MDSAVTYKRPLALACRDFATIAVPRGRPGSLEEEGRIARHASLRKRRTGWKGGGRVLLPATCYRACVWAYSHHARRTAVLQNFPHSNSYKIVSNQPLRPRGGRFGFCFFRPLRPRRGRFGTLLQQLKCGVSGRTAVWSGKLGVDPTVACLPLQ